MQVAPELVVVGAALVVDVDDDVFARVLDDEDDDEVDDEDDMSIGVAAGEEPGFSPRDFSFHSLLPLSDLLDENSAEKRRLVKNVKNLQD